MSWDAVGAIGEVVGAAAVVLTLVYLASRVRHAKAAADDTNRLTRASGVREMLMAVAVDDGLRESVVRSSGDQPFYQALAEALDMFFVEEVLAEPAVGEGPST